MPWKVVGLSGMSALLALRYRHAEYDSVVDPCVTDYSARVSRNNAIGPAAGSKSPGVFRAFPITAPGAGWPRHNASFCRVLGFAGIPNPLFAMENTMMSFSDGKAAVQDRINAVKENE